MAMVNQCIWTAILFTVHLDTYSTTSSYNVTGTMTKSDTNIDVVDLNSHVLTVSKLTVKPTMVVAREIVSIWIVKLSHAAIKVSAI